MNMQLAQPINICAVIVTYHPDKNIISLVNDLRHQVQSVIIIDNHSSETEIAMLSALAKNPNVDLIFNQENYGVGKALNQGVAWAKDHGYLYTILLDQDSKPFERMVYSLIALYNELVIHRKVAIVGAHYRCNSEPFLNVTCKDSCGARLVRTVITSGSLLSITAYSDIGSFREELFIDHVDDEYCLRARSKGYDIYISSEPLMLHSIGQQTKHRFFCLLIGTSNHTVIRRYYIYRNYSILMREYWFMETIWSLKTTYSRVASIILMCLFERDLLIKLKAILLGIRHGLKRKYYKLEIIIAMLQQ